MQAGTVIGRDLNLRLGPFSPEQLDEVLSVLREMLADRQATLQADPARGLLMVSAPGAPQVTLSREAASDLWPAAARQGDERAYLAAMLVSPRYGRWATQFVPLAGMLTSEDLAPEYTELQVLGEGPQRQVKRVRLENVAEALGRHHAVALLGEPGAGKTTTLYRLALEAARRRLEEGQGPFPVFLPLADYRGYRSPHELLEAQWKWVGTADLQARVDGGGVLLLCDALNEMPFEDERDYRVRVGEWRRFIAKLAERPGNQVVVTCRSRDYGEPLGLPQVEIERLDDPRVQTFLARYLTSELAGEAWGRLEGSPLLDLVRNPWYLAMLAALVKEGGDWPRSRAALFKGFVRLLLAREHDRNHPDWPGEEALAMALSGLAETLQPFGAGVRLPRKEARQRIPRTVETADGPVDVAPAVVERLGLAATLLDTEVEPRREGERDARAEEQLRFYHHQLQEYFSARALLSRFAKGEDLAPRWRQRRLVREMPDPGPLGPDEPLPGPPTTGWEEPTVLAAGLAEDAGAFVEAVRRANPVLAARCLSEVGAAADPGQVQGVQNDLLAAMGNRKVHLRHRIAAGEALGSLGDPRFQALAVDGQRVLLRPLVPLPAGAFRVGSSLWELLRLRLSKVPAGDEFPPCQVPLPAFWIGRYPVTNAEYACFWQAGGYQDERWWPTPRLGPGGAAS